MTEEIWETIVDANTGEVTRRRFTEEEVAARIAWRNAMSVPESITRRQCAKQLLVLGLITAQEAIDMTQSGKPPAMVQAYLDQVPEPDRTFAIIDFAADSYFRNNPLLTALMTANGMTEEQVDQYFRDAAAM